MHSNDQPTQRGHQHSIHNPNPNFPSTSTSNQAQNNETLIPKIAQITPLQLNSQLQSVENKIN